MKARAGLVLLVLFSLSCANNSTIVPLDAIQFHFQPHEKNLWSRAANLSYSIDRSDALYKNESLQTFLNEVLNNLVAPYQNTPAEFNVRIILDPFFNAFALPNGRI